MGRSAQFQESSGPACGGGVGVLSAMRCELIAWLFISYASVIRGDWIWLCVVDCNTAFSFVLTFFLITIVANYHVYQ